METTQMTFRAFVYENDEEISAGKPGTEEQSRQYGSDLVPVRYRYDSEQGLNFKASEPVVERSLEQGNAKETPGETIMHLRIEYGEDRPG